jgi:hypothetical protein
MTIIFIIVSLFLLASGFAIVFVYFPRWLVHHYELTAKRKMVAYFALAGFCPCCFYVHISPDAYKHDWRSRFPVADCTDLDGLDGHASVSAVIANFALAILSNVGLYAWMGLLAAWIRKNFSNKSLEV